MSITPTRPIVQQFIIEVLENAANVAADTVLDIAELIGKIFSSSDSAPQVENLSSRPGNSALSLEARVRALFEAVED